MLSPQIWWWQEAEWCSWYDGRNGCHPGVLGKLEHGPTINKWVSTRQSERCHTWARANLDEKGLREELTDSILSTWLCLCCCWLLPSYLLWTMLNSSQIFPGWSSLLSCWCLHSQLCSCHLKLFWFHPRVGELHKAVITMWKSPRISYRVQIQISTSQVKFLISTAAEIGNLSLCTHIFQSISLNSVCRLWQSVWIWELEFFPFLLSCPSELTSKWEKGDNAPYILLYSTLLKTCVGEKQQQQQQHPWK